jgi:hypothetical protein
MNEMATSSKQLRFCVWSFIDTRHVQKICKDGLARQAHSYPPGNLLDSLLNPLMTTLKKSHRGIGSGCVYFQPAVKTDHLPDNLVSTRSAPGGPLLEAFLQQSLVTD